MLGEELRHHHESDVYNSEIHKRTINLGEFIKFLDNRTEEESLTDIRNSWYYKEYKGGIRNIAEGEKLWESSVPAVVELRVWIEDVVLAIASNQQFCELTIKETGNVSCLNRSVAMKSVISIIWAHLNQRKAVILEDKIKDHSFHANQHTTGEEKR